MNKAGIEAGEVDWVVPHQANVRIIQGTARKMGIPDEKVIKTVQDHGKNQKTIRKGLKRSDMVQKRY